MTSQELANVILQSCDTEIITFIMAQCNIKLPKLYKWLTLFKNRECDIEN